MLGAGTGVYSQNVIKVFGGQVGLDLMVGVGLAYIGVYTMIYGHMSSPWQICAPQVFFP